VTESTPDAVETRVPKLTIGHLAVLRELNLDEDTAAVVAQVERPRLNLGGSGPPGRAD